MKSPTIPLLLRVFVAAGTCLPSRCLAPKKGIHLSEPFPSNDRGDARTDRLMRGIYEVRRSDRDSYHDIHTKFHKNYSRHSKVIREGYTHTQTGWRSHKPTLGKQAKN
jgi:hypothetical protein